MTVLCARRCCKPRLPIRCWTGFLGAGRGLQPRPKRFRSRVLDGVCNPVHNVFGAGCWTGFATPSETFGAGRGFWVLDGVCNPVHNVFGAGCWTGFLGAGRGLQPRPKRFRSRVLDGVCNPVRNVFGAGCWTGFATPSETFSSCL